MCSGRERMLAHMDSQQPCSPTYDQGNHHPSVEWRGVHEPPSLTEELLSIAGFCRKERSGFLKAKVPGRQQGWPHAPMDGLVSMSLWAAQSEPGVLVFFGFGFGLK